MKAYQKLNKVVGVAAMLLLLVATFAMTLQAQTFPKPAMPPTAAKLPGYQTTPSGFDDLGFIQYASVDQMCDPLPAPPAPQTPTPAGCKTSGGWLQINNDVIRIPANAVVFFPNTYQTWEEIFENNPGAVMCTGPKTCSLTPPVHGESGLALSDLVRSEYTFEAHVQGQNVNGQYIAGLVYISQQSVNGIQGFIEKLNYADGSMIVNGRRIQINDPVLQITDRSGNVITKGRYTVGQTPDLRFTADQNNTTVRAATGYPMCIPRTDPAVSDDPQCPQKNRLKDAAGNLLGIYTMNPPDAGPTVDNPVPQDPWTETPFEVGDFVSVIGTQFRDPVTGDPYISATEVVGNLSIFTAPGTDPAYMQIEVLLMGTGGVPDPAFPQEAARRTRVEGFSTDDTRNVDISAVDIDPCGNLSFRLPAWVSNFPVENGIPLIGVRGRWRFRPNGGTFLPPVQNIAAQISGGLQVPNNNGLITDYYQLPVGEFIFPEQLPPGNPPVKYNFTDLPFLLSGTGPWPSPASVYDSTLIQLGLKRDEVPQPQANQFIGQLNPFPDNPSSVPGAPVCAQGTNQNAAHAVASFTASTNPITAGTVVTLNSTASTPANGPFAWQQIVNPGDPIVNIINANQATASFVAPVVASSLNLTFQLKVGGANTTAFDLKNVTIPIIVPPAGTPPAVTATSAPANPVASNALVTLNASGVDPSGGTLTYKWTAPAGITLTSAGGNGSVQTFTAPIVPTGTAAQAFTFTVTATSSNGLSNTANVSVAVNPQTDTVNVITVVYRRAISRLVISAFDSTPGVRLFVTTDIINPATGQPYQGEMGPTFAAGPGTFSLIFVNVPAPNVITITSSAGGTTSSGITVLR